MPDVLFVHNNYPAQFAPLANVLRARGWRTAAIGSASARNIDAPVRRWRLKRGTTKGVFPLAVRAEADLLRARAAADCALDFRKQGLKPNLIIGHPGWGETLLLGEIFPEAPQILHGEFFYHAQGADVGFDPEFGRPDLDERFRIAAKNATLALAYANADAIVCPTPFQAAQLPSVFAARTHIIHEGVNTFRIAPRPKAVLTLPNGRVVDRTTPVVTLINRNLEPMRGYHVFMRALPAILDAVPDAIAVVIGGEGEGYGAPPPEGGWRARLEGELGARLDRSRVHYLGRVPHTVMLDALAVSSAHVYYTYPFVLSWSLLEAMAMECLVVASDTPPLHDAITHERTGLLHDFFDTEALAGSVISAMRHPERYQPLREAARRTILERFDRSRRCLPAWLDLIERVAAK